MADAPQPENRTQFTIQKIYVKDLSFEAPNSPKVFLEKWEPEVSLQISNNATALSETTQEVVLTLTVTAKQQDRTVYLIEIQQAGIFTIEGYEAEQLAAMVGGYCPHVLFPFARETVSDVVIRGGFPQLLLAPINFDVLYRQHVEQMNQGRPATDSKH